MPKTRQNLSFTSYFGMACGIVGLLGVIYGVQEIFGYDVKGRKLDKESARIPLSIVLASMPISVGIAYFIYRRHREIHDDGIETQGTIVVIGSIVMSGGRDITFSYVYAGHVYTQSKSLPNEHALAYKIGDPIELLILPRNPDRFLIL